MPAAEVTVSAPVNIAVIKYWGKRDTSLLLPTNSSLSVTLSQDHLRSTTTVRADPSLTADRLWLNGKEEDISASKRLTNVISECRRVRKQYEDEARGKGEDVAPLSTYHLHIASENNFPTAAGLASSASGFAALTFGISKALASSLSHSELSRLARLGSGSACRSLFGGFVAWEMGEKADGTDSVAVQVAPETHWPEMEALILVASDERKATGSTEGMQRTVATSGLLRERLNQVPQRMKDMSDAILAKDYDAFAEITMRDSNSFHAVCLDTYPPVFYLNDVSRGVIRLITEYNRLHTTESKDKDGIAKGYKAAYTFDAGPNAVLYILRENVPEVLALVNKVFPPPTAEDERAEYFGRATEFMGKVDEAKIEELVDRLKIPSYPAGSLRRIISTRVGDGPRVMAGGYDAEVSLLKEDGVPKRTV
ncbi:diphosphomevalonate decarboxylase [Borealophlyctis nickersoniae]|nr:diphosphomevalonate decarboxylase [Borealophlyctis nickersoniae]